MTPADELRTAAQKLRALTTAIEAPDLPDQSWHVEPCASEERGDCPCIVAQGRTSDPWPPTAVYYVADAETPECAAYIAAMGPNVGLALANWLESWVGIDFNEHAAMAGDLAHALAVARQINRSQ